MSKLLREAEEVNPNLIPIMNLFTALIPFLLMSAVFYQMSVIQITIPVASSTGETDIAKEEDKITLNLQILPDRFELSAASDTMEPAKLEALRATLKRVEGDEAKVKAMYAQISAAARKIKGNYISSDTVIVVPEPEINYEVIIGAVDAVRKFREEDGGSVRLFDKVVLSARVK